MRSTIFILADGARADVFEELLRRGELPNISRYIVDRGSYREATSVFPSTTGPAYAPFLMGKFPGRCNLPGIRWFDRRLYGTKLLSPFRFRSYVGLESYLMNRDVSKDYLTLFETFPNSVNIISELSRGAGFRRDKTKILRAYYKIKAHFNRRWDEVDEISRRILLRSLRKTPQFVFAVLLGIDTFSHLNHPFHEKVIESYRRIDDTVGLVASFLKDVERLDETLLIVTSDHGLTLTHTHFDSIGFMNSLGYKTFYYPKIFKHLWNATAANMISGNAMMHLYVKNGRGWEERNPFDELSVLVQSLLERPEVDIVAGLDEEGRVRIRSERGKAVISKSKNRDGGLTYEYNGGDPFGYSGIPRVMDKEEALRVTFNTGYPDALVQIVQLLESPRSGDLVVSAKEGFDLRVKHEKPEHCSSHGSLIRGQMMVPLAMNIKIKKKYIRTVDVYSTILRFMGKTIPEGVDGVSLI